MTRVLTEIAFHFGAADKVAYAVRLLRKAVGTGARVLVLGYPDLVQRLDAALWGSAPTEFFTHCLSDASDRVLAMSSVVLVAEGGPIPSVIMPVLVNLGAQMPQGFEHHQRVIEVVSVDEDDRNLARQRWKSYTALGYTIVRHDLQLRS